MAPIQMVGMLREMRSVAWFSSPEVGIISLCVFLILSITLVALCLKCRRNPSNAYDVNGVTTDGPNGVKVTTDYTEWRNHKDMPKSTLDRNPAEVN